MPNKVKKIFLVALTALIATVSMNAQAGYYTKHEIGISYGFGSNSDIVNGFGGGLGKSLNKTHFNWQASLVGIEAGGGALRCFAELGIGEQGMALLGIRYKF